MAPIKFEEHIKETLEKRELQPSSDSWAKLSKQLDKDVKQNKKKSFWWLGIAAGIVIMLAISVQLLNNSTGEKIQPQVVEEPQDNIIEPQDNIELKDVKTEELFDKTPMPKNQPIVNSPISRPEEESLLNPQKRPLDKVGGKGQMGEQLASIENTTVKENGAKNELDKKDNVFNGDLQITETSVAELIKDLNEKSSESNLDREVDSLLKLASKELLISNLRNEGARTVNANSLLESVQEEMGQSFRTKIFEALKDSYQTVKTAVAERNN